MYEQCANCGGWIRIDKEHITAVIDNKKVHIHDEACLRILKHKVVVTDIKRVPSVIYQD